MEKKTRAQSTENKYTSRARYEKGGWNYAENELENDTVRAWQVVFVSEQRYVTVSVLMFAKYLFI